MIKIQKFFFSIIDYVRVILLRLIKRNVHVGNKVVFKGKPILVSINNSKIIIGSFVKLDSRNKFYHLNMFAPTKLLADGDGSQIVIGENTKIHGSCIHAHKSISIGKNCLIAANTQIFDDSGHKLQMENPDQRVFSRGIPKEVIIGDNVWIGTGAIILPGTVIGSGTVIGAGSVVSGIFPEKVLVSGNPAQIIKHFK